MDANFFELTQDLVHDHNVRMFAVPTGRKWIKLVDYS
jgi:hypothetical protein